MILDRSPDNMAAFLARHAHRKLSESDEITVWKLLELQRHAMLMYTSCGWFFDELSGIETVQVIQYASRALQLAQDVFADPSLESAFLAKLAEAKSNLAEHQDGARIFEKFVRPAIVDFPKLAAHYAIRSVFEEYGEHAKIYSYEVDRGSILEITTSPVACASSSGNRSTGPLPIPCTRHFPEPILPKSCSCWTGASTRTSIP